MELKFTAVFEQVPEGYIGYVEELPGATPRRSHRHPRASSHHGVNRAAGKATSVPRHREINDFLARKICRDLEVAEP